MLTLVLLATALMASTITPESAAPPDLAAGGAGTPKSPRDGPPRRLRLPGMRPAPPPPLALAHDIDLFSACLGAGLGPAHAAGAVATVSEVPAWGDAASLLALGVPASRAWEELGDVPGLEELAILIVMSEQSGAAIASGAARLAQALRDDAADAATARAERAGVFISLPLALCFLPAFIVLGLAPIVISLGTDLLAR